VTMVADPPRSPQSWRDPRDLCRLPAGNAHRGHEHRGSRHESGHGGQGERLGFALPRSAGHRRRRAAEQGTLTIMAAEARKISPRRSPSLRPWEESTPRWAYGYGSVLKLCANLVAASIITSMNEALVLAAKSGLDLGVVTEVLTERSPLIGRTAPKVLSGTFRRTFP